MSTPSIPTRVIHSIAASVLVETHRGESAKATSAPPTVKAAEDSAATETLVKWPRKTRRFLICNFELCFIISASLVKGGNAIYRVPKRS